MIAIDIPMPEHCYECPLCTDYDGLDGYCNLLNENHHFDDRSADCPLRSVKILTFAHNQNVDLLEGMSTGERMDYEDFVDQKAASEFGRFAFQNKLYDKVYQNDVIPRTKKWRYRMCVVEPKEEEEAAKNAEQS